MIRRRANEGFLLIAQNDHALLAGEMARHFGGARFAAPDPCETVVSAIASHDCGWPLHDDHPTINSDGRPLDVFETPRSLAMNIWSASAAQAAERDAYAGLLVSLHSLWLSIPPAEPAEKRGRDNSGLHARFELNKFQHREIERQETLRSRLGFRTDIPLKFGLADRGIDRREDLLEFNFRLLRAMDLASLAICCSEISSTISAEMLTAPGGKSVQLSLHRKGERELNIRPWPFDAPELKLSLPCRQVEDRAFQDDAALQRAWAESPIFLLPLRVSPV